jgi:hypothetical protein
VIRGAAFASILAALAATGVAAKAITPGVYGDVRYIEEAGDLLGMELELFGGGDNAHVEFVVCEGECSEVFREQVRLTPDGFRFHYFQHRVGRAEGTIRMEVEAHRVGNRLRVTVTPSDSAERAYSETLARRAKRYALAIAERP